MKSTLMSEANSFICCTFNEEVPYHTGHYFDKTTAFMVVDDFVLEINVLGPRRQWFCLLFLILTF